MHEKGQTCSLAPRLRTACRAPQLASLRCILTLSIPPVVLRLLSRSAPSSFVSPPLAERGSRCRRPDRNGKSFRE